MGIFDKVMKAGLLNDPFNALYRLMSTAIVTQRDYNLERLQGESVNKTELALACFGDSHVCLCYDRLTEIMASFYYSIEAENDDLKSFLEEQILDRRELIYESLSPAKVTGVAALEVMWDKNQGKVVAEDLVPVDSNRILYELPPNHYKYKLRITTFNDNFTGLLVEPAKIIDYQFYSVYINNPYGLGVGGLLIELVRKKELVETIWFEIAKKYSQPVKIGKVPNDASKIDVDEFFEALNGMKKSATFVLPEGFELDVIDVSGSGAEGIVQPLLDYYDSKISGLLLGESITGKELANGSQSRDIVANDITVRKAFSLAQSITTRLNQTLVKWLIAYNFPGEKAKIVVNEPENLKELLDSYEKLGRLGVEFDAEWLANKFGVQQEPPRRVLGDNI